MCVCAFECRQYNVTSNTCGRRFCSGVGCEVESELHALRSARTTHEEVTGHSSQVSGLCSTLAIPYHKIDV